MQPGLGVPAGCTAEVTVAGRDVLAEAEQGKS